MRIVERAIGVTMEVRDVEAINKVVDILSNLCAEMEDRNAYTCYDKEGDDMNIDDLNFCADLLKKVANIEEIR